MDLGIVIDGWPYSDDNEPDNVRKVTGVDGRMKLQVRIRNGLLQWEAEGRPDGRRPNGCADLVQHCGRLLAEDGAPADVFDAEMIEELALELFDYYRRSQALFHLGDYTRALSDIAHCLKVLTLLQEHAPQEALQFDQYRPGLLVDKARAEMLCKVQEGNLREALAALNNGIGEIEAFYLGNELDDQIAESPERQMLIELRRSLRERHNVPLEDQELLRSLQLEQQIAIDRENYEMAARLRDKINSLKQRIRSQE